MAKFTPGPWVFETIKGSPQSSINNGKTIIAGIPNCFGEDKEETMGNGNLIAAAPDMYEALCMAANSLMSVSYALKAHGLDGFMATDIIDRANRCNAALAKARGEK